MAIRKRRLIRPTDKLPTKADRLAAEAAERERIDNVINRPADPAPDDHYASFRRRSPTGRRPALRSPLADATSALQRLGRSLRDLAPPAPPSVSGYGGYQVREITETNGEVKVSAMGPNGVVASFSIERSNYELLRQTGSLDIGTMLNIEREVDRIDRHVIGQLAPEESVLSVRTTVQAGDLPPLNVDDMEYMVPNEEFHNRPTCPHCGSNHYGHDYCAQRSARRRCPGCDAETGGTCPDCYGGIG